MGPTPLKATSAIALLGFLREHQCSPQDKNIITALQIQLHKIIYYLREMLNLKIK